MFKFLLSIVITFLLFGCATRPNYKTLEGYMQKDKCTLAEEYLKKTEKGYGINERLLFLLDSAMVEMLCGRYKESNKHFQKAEDLAEKLWTKSITKEASAFLLNDYTRPYAGEDFERAIINLFSALNYIELQQYDEALVECRRLDAVLTMFNDKYEKKNVYKEDAFARYLSGILYEADVDLDNAYIDYYKAFKTFKDYERNYGTSTPSILIEDLRRTAVAVDRLNEIESELINTGKIKKLNYSKTQGLGKIVFIHFNSKSPVKVQDRIFIPSKYGPITIAFPKYIEKKPRCRESSLIVESKENNIDAKSVLLEDINKIAVKNLKDRKGRIILKAIVRAAAKQAAIHSITKDETARKLLNIANIFIEKADTRSWRTLPGEIYLTRVFAPPGNYKTYVRQCRNRKAFLEYINLKAGETEFILYESMY